MSTSRRVVFGGGLQDPFLSSHFNDEDLQGAMTTAAVPAEGCLDMGAVTQ